MYHVQSRQCCVATSSHAHTIIVVAVLPAAVVAVAVVVLARHHRHHIICRRCRHVYFAYRPPPSEIWCMVMCVWRQTTHQNEKPYLLLKKKCIRKCSADIRDKSAKHWSDESVFSNRAYFLFEKQNELAIQNIKDGDSGIYRCRVDFEVGQTRNSKVNLTVICEYY